MTRAHRNLGAVRRKFSDTPPSVLLFVAILALGQAASAYSPVKGWRYLSWVLVRLPMRYQRLGLDSTRLAVYCSMLEGQNGNPGLNILQFGCTLI